MKKLIPFLLLLMVFSSCKKDNTIPTAFSFNAGGTVLSGQTYDAAYHHDTLAGDWAFSGKLFAGDTALENYVQLNFVSNNYIAPGTYAYGNTYPGNTTIGLGYFNGILSYAETSGTLTITQIDTVNRKISGTFQFSAVNTANGANTISITGGQFNTLVYVIQ